MKLKLLSSLLILFSVCNKAAVRASCIGDDSKCSSGADDCCACDASIGQTTCGWEEPATCRDGYVAVPTPGADGGMHGNPSCRYSCYPPGCGSSLVYVAEPQDYEGAQAACAARGGALANVGSRAEALGTAWTGDREIWIADSAEGTYDTCTSSDCPCISCALASERKPFICDARSAGGSAPPTDDCSALSPCGTCGGNHCTTAGCPFRGFECNALNDNQPNEQPGTCRFNVIDPGYDGYDYYNSGSCQDMCSTFGWDCVRLEEYSDNVCGAQFVASYDCDQPVSTYPGHPGHAMCTCSPRTTSRRRLEPAYGPIELSSSCSDFNCFDGAHIMGHDITCEVGVSEAECADMCCSQANCKGFDFSASDHGMGAGRCCT